jgi:hypothetical protein
MNPMVSPEVGAAVQIATATPGPEVRPASVMGLTKQTCVGANAKQTTIVGQALHAPILATRGLYVEVLPAFLSRIVRRVIRGLARGEAPCCTTCKVLRRKRRGANSRDLVVTLMKVFTATKQSPCNAIIVVLRLHSTTRTTDRTALLAGDQNE